MAETQSRPRLVRFGSFEADVQTGELRKDGVKLKFSGQPFQVLAILLERPGDVVTREELQKRLWPDTFVDVERNLNTAVNKIREVLGDSAEVPHFIETLPRRGYRFIGKLEAPPDATPVDSNGVLNSGRVGLETAPPLLPQVDPVPKRGTSKEGSRNRFRGWLLPGAAVLAIAIAVILIISAAAMWVGYLRRRGTAPAIHSIAVLPLENLSGDPSQEYFADGMTDALITDLAKLSSIRVISRTSVMQYKRPRKSLPQIARELDVDAVVEGVVVRSGQNVRISAQLIEATTDRHLWADSYERDSHDILLLQNQVALAIAEQVLGQVALEERNRFRADRVNPDAYDDYVKGRYFWSKFTLESVNMSRDFFNRALEKDPTYAPAHVGLAESQINLIFAYSIVAPADGCKKAEGESVRALELDHANAEAHATLARFKLQCAWDWTGAENEFSQAIELEPGSSEVHHQYAHYLMAMGRIREAWAESTRALELDPYGIRVNSHQGWHHFYAREYDLAIRDFQRTLSMEPSDTYSRRFLANSYEGKGMFLEAIAELQKIPMGTSRTPQILAALGYAQAMAGNRRKAMGIASELETESKREYVSAVDIGLIYLGLGDKDKALDWLEQAFRERSALLIYLRVDPRLDTLRSNHRFQDLVRNIGLNG